MTRVVFGRLARAEMREAAEWYAMKGKRLRERFVAETEQVIERIVQNPLQFPIVLRNDVRRARLKRFPCALFFRLRDETAFVVACFHSSRDPRRWQLRT